MNETMNYTEKILEMEDMEKQHSCGLHMLRWLHYTINSSEV